MMMVHDDNHDVDDDRHTGGNAGLPTTIRGSIREGAREAEEFRFQGYQ